MAEPDLTPVATEWQQLRTFHTQHEIDVLTAAAFAERSYPACACGSTIDERGTTVCHPCRMGNRRTCLYSGGISATAPSAAWQEQRIAALEAENASLRLERLQAEECVIDVRRENSALAERVVYLTGQLALRSR